MPSGKIPLQQFAGLVTAPGLLERNPASCIQAVNWEFPAPGVMRKRRGNKRLTGNAGGPVWKLLTSRLLDDELLAHVGTTTSGTQLRFGDGVAALTTIPVIDGGDVTRGRDPRMQMALAQRNHYLTADEGVIRLESDFASGSSARYAGMPRGEGLRTLDWGSKPPLIAGTNFGDGYARGYRVTWHRKDADGVELGGAPTTRFVIANRSYFAGYTGATRSFVLQVWLPEEFGTLNTALTDTYYWRLWGVRTYLEATELGDDEMHLIAERFLTAGEISAGYFEYTDSTPDSFLSGSPTLNTNLFNFPPQEAGVRQGVVNEDAPPPVANDVSYWQDVLWYADCTWRASLDVGLISNFSDGDTVTLYASTTTVVLTAKTAPAAATDFAISSGAPTTALNIRQTVVAMVECININCAALGLRAYHVSTTTTQPGLVHLEVTRPDAAPIEFNSSAPTRLQTGGGYQLGTTYNAPAATNALAFSKPLRADAVPPINVLTAGPADSRILRIHPLRDRMLVFTDYGIYQVTGRTFADFAVFPFDLGYRLMGREYVALCDEKLYAWCFEGIVEIDDGGVRVISAPIEPTIEAALVAAGTLGGNPPLEAGRTAFAEQGFATAYRNQHQVRFHYPQTNDALAMNGCAYWLSFDTRTRTWAQGQFSVREIAGYYDNRLCAAVRFSDDLLAFGNWSTGADTFLFLERRSYAATDFIDTAIAGGDEAVASVARFQYQMPDASGAQHWQQTVINWDAEEISWRPLPTSIQAAHGTEGVAPAGQTVTVSELVTRIETPRDARRGQRLFVTLTHALAEYAGIVGLEQTYRQGTRFARRVAP